jgi:tetratricopeptide (TPR) repeat protein
MNRAKPNNRPSITSPLGDALGVCPQASPQVLHLPLTQSPEQYIPLPTLTCPPKAGSASASSRTQIEKHRLIIVGLSSIQSEVITHLCRQAEIAYTLRQPDKLEAVCRQLEQVHAPIASYYRGYLEQRHDLSAAERHLEYALNYAPRYYQARAALVLGNVANHQQDYNSELKFYRYVLDAHAFDPFAVAEAHRALAIQASIEGEHDRSIDLLQKVIPIAISNPYLQAQVFNSLAVELRAVGRLHEAVRLASIACESPLASVYHEWRETREEISEDLREQEARPIIVAAPHIQEREEKQPEDLILNHFHTKLRVDHFDLPIAPIITDPPTVHLIQSRLMRSINPHAPPFRAGK